jgi:RNA polymerase sigma factor (sigma-70 family)
VSLWPDTQFSLIGRLANAGDASAWQRFEQCYQAAIYRLARGKGLRADEALDVVQEVMLAVHRQAKQWQPAEYQGSFRAWLSETIRRQAFAAIRFRNRAGTALDAVTEPMITEGASATSDEQEWLFYEAIADVEKEISPQHWRVFWMTTIEELDPKLVAEKLDIRLGTVYSIKSRVLMGIRSRIAELQKMIQANDQGEQR